jgi:hypothetical protein
MDHVLKRGQIHQKPFGRSPLRHNSEVRFYRYRRDADPSPFSRRYDTLDEYSGSPSPL